MNVMHHNQERLARALETLRIRRGISKPHNSSRKPLARLRHALWALEHPNVIEYFQEFNIRNRRGKWSGLRALDALKEK